ncbi:MAG: hypothetical protein JNM36_13900 [Chitinophagales bacterium]|nr:hypothetical protein [Chitinophagales bacterium]
MSTNSSITIKYYQKIKPTHIIEKLLQTGWCINDYGKIYYLPLGDVDFEWQSTDLSNWNTVKTILFQKEQKEETIGISLVFKNTRIGFLLNCLSDSPKSITLSLMINRAVIKGTSITDFSWYLNRLTVLITDLTESIECFDCY